MPGISKELLKKGAMYFITLFFLFEGFINITDTQRKSAFETKAFNTEVYLQNRNLLLFRFEPFLTSMSTLIVLTLGLLYIAGGFAFIFFEQHKKHTRVIEWLIVLLLADVIVVHNPMPESFEQWS